MTKKSPLALVTRVVIVTCLLTTACNKQPTARAAYLELSHGIINVGNTKGSSHSFQVQSNLEWQLQVEPAAAAAWISLDKTTGTGTATITATAAQDNPDKIIRRAEIIGRATNETAVQHVSLLLIQNDTTIIKCLNDIPIIK